MDKKKFSKMKIIQHALAVMMIGSFLFFLLGEALFPKENVSNDGSTFGIFQTEWMQIKKDGTKIPVAVPGECETESGDWVTITTTLSEQQGDTWICVRSMQQDMKFYVGEELRKEYSTLDTQPFGKTSTMTYVLLPLYESDAGEEFRIEFMSKSFYAGYVSEIYNGEKSDIIQYFYSTYMPGTIVATLMFLIGLLVVAASIFVWAFYKKKVDIIHLGNAVMLTALWLLVESRIRQFIFPNSTIAMLMGFLLIAVLPYPFLSYINSVQNNRYKKVYAIIAGCTAVNYIIIVALQVLNIMDFFETMTLSHIILVALILTMGATIVIDIIKGYVKEYREVAIGFAGLMLAGVAEIGLAYVISAEINGIALNVGLVGLLATAGLKSVRDIFHMEREKQYAIATSESKAQFLANMSHEIRTPINTIIGMNEMILRENENEDVEEYAENIKSASQMLLGLINDVLDFSKIEAGKLQIVENNYELAGMLNDVILGIGMRAEEKKLEVKIEIDEKMPAVLLGDEIRIKQILNNLLSNAIKYTEKGSVTLSVNGMWKDEQFSLNVSVKDTGIGIRKEDIEKLFNSFERLELKKNRYIQGTGLGLNITQMLVRLMNGTIDVQSKYGIGSCFTVCLPQVVVDKTAMGALEKKNKSVKAKKEKNTRVLEIPDARILAVDDTKMNLVVIKALLKQTRCQLDTATSGLECIQLTKNKKYDLILMDHMMPEPDGIQTLHLIREDEENLNQETPMVVLTANAIVGMKEMYLAEGFMDYLSKPVEVTKLETLLTDFFCKIGKGKIVKK